MHLRKPTLFSKNHSEMDLTNGNLFWKFPLFALPLAFTTILQLLYTTMDLYTVSTFGGGSLSMSAVGSNTALINLIVTVFVNMSIGANVAISHAKGANNKQKAEDALHTSIVLAFIFGIIVGLFGFFFSKILLGWMNTPSSIIEKAAEYLKIYFVGLPFLMIYNYGSQILRALGDSKKPLLVLALSGVINITFDIVLVKYANMDVSGVGLATVMSEALACVLTICFLRFNKGFVKLEFKKLRINKKALKDVLFIGLPAGIQGLAFCIPNVLIQSSLYTISDYSINGIAISQDEIVSGSSASTQLENFAFAVEDAIGVSLCTFIGQNYGANKKENIKKLFITAMIWNAIFSGVIVLVYYLASSPLLSIFVSESQGVNRSNAIAAGQQRLFIMMFPCIFDGIMIICGDYLRGMNISTPPAIVTIIGCTGLRILFLLTLFNLPFFHTIFWLFAAYPISWVIVDICYIPLLIHFNKKALARLSPTNTSVTSNN